LLCVDILPLFAIAVQFSEFDYVCMFLPFLFVRLFFVFVFSYWLSSVITPLFLEDMTLTIRFLEFSFLAKSDFCALYFYLFVCQDLCILYFSYFIDVRIPVMLFLVAFCCNNLVGPLQVPGRALVVLFVQFLAILRFVLLIN